jgi:hypothetical protein
MLQAVRITTTNIASCCCRQVGHDCQATGQLTQQLCCASSSIIFQVTGDALGLFDLQMIEEGRLQPWKVASHMLPLSEAPEGYAKFDAKEFNKVHSICSVGLCSLLHLSFVARVVPIISTAASLCDMVDALAQCWPPYQRPTMCCFVSSGDPQAARRACCQRLMHVCSRSCRLEVARYIICP